MGVLTCFTLVARLPEVAGCEVINKTTVMRDDDTGTAGGLDKPNTINTALVI